MRGRMHLGSTTRARGTSSPMHRAFLLAALLLAACGARTGLRVDGDGEGAGAIGGGHSCVRTKIGDVYCWGRNGSGQLGVETVEGQSEVPVKVALQGDATLLAAGTYHTCAVVDGTRLFCWGRNDDGQI